MQKNRIALALSAALLSAFVFADGGKAATVNGVVIPESKVDFLVKQVTARGQATDTPELRTRIREDLVRNEIVVQEAAKKGLDKSPEVTSQLEMAKSQILFGAFINDYVKNNPIPEADLKKGCRTGSHCTAAFCYFVKTPPQRGVFHQECSSGRKSPLTFSQQATTRSRGRK